MLTTLEKKLIADELKKLVMHIQNFVDSVSQEAAESEEMQPLLLAQTDFATAYVEQTGKEVF